MKWGKKMEGEGGTKEEGGGKTRSVMFRGNVGI